MISWPSIIHHKGEDDLLFISDGKEWNIDPDLYYHPYCEGDVMIDCDGQIFELPYNDDEKRVEIKNTGSSISLKEFEVLVKKHLSFVGQCCVEKINLKSYAEGINLVEKTSD